jgi:uncharacterized membrane protein
MKTSHSKRQPLSLKELKNMTPRVRNANIEHKAHLTRLERFAIVIADRAGSMSFFLLVFAWTVLWLAWNMLAPAPYRFDPYPAFVLWLFISNMIQLFLTPLLLIGQNLESRHSEARAESDFEVNIKAEKEIESVLWHLEKQDDMVIQSQKDIKDILEELKKQDEMILKILAKLEDRSERSS